MLLRRGALMINDMLMVVAGSSGVVIEFSGITINPDLYALAYAKGYRGVGPVIARVLSGADVGGLVISNSFPNKAVFIEVNSNARLGGMGGLRGSRGGTGVYTRREITIANLGLMFGGGGGGGEGNGGRLCWGGDCHTANGGYGGRGGGYYSQDGTGNAGTWLYQSTGAPGNSGGYSSRPPSGYPGDSGSTISAGFGGNGGDVGQPGLPGGGVSFSGSYDTSTTVTGAAPGLAGYYVDGNSFVTWLATGTRLGNVI